MFPKHSQLFTILKLHTVSRKLLRNYHLQPGEENLCLVTTYANELELEVRKMKQPNENEVLLRVGSCCISPYDFDYLMRFRGKDHIFDKSLVLGTFGTGIVLEAGAKVNDKFNVGDHVVLEPGIYCDTCVFCTEGKTNLCSQIKYLGSEELDGILCRFINHPAQFIHKLPPGVSLELGTLTTKVACCIHSYQRSGIKKDSKVLMIGTNLLGLIAVMIFKHLGVGNVLVAETNNYKLKMAQNVGADYVIKLPSLYSPEYPEYLQQIINSIQLGQPDIVIDTMGTASSIENSFNLTKSGGRLVLMNHMARPIKTNFAHSTLREIDLVGAYSYSHSSFTEALKLLSQDAIPFKKITPIQIPLERALDAFSHGRATGGENIFIIVNCYAEKADKMTESIDINKGSEEKAAKTPDLTQVSQIPDQTKPSNPNSKELSTSSKSEVEKESKEKNETVLDSSKFSQVTDPTKPSTPTNKELPASSAAEKEKGGEEKTSNISNLTPFSKISDPTKPPTPTSNGIPATETGPSVTEKESKDKIETTPESSKVSLITDKTKPLTSTSEKFPPDSLSGAEKGSKISQKPEPIKGPTLNKESQRSASETEKGSNGKKEIHEPTQKTDKLAANDKKKLNSTNPIDVKNNGDIKKERNYENILRSKNENHLQADDKEKTPQRKETEQDISFDKKDNKK